MCIILNGFSLRLRKIAVCHSLIMEARIRKVSYQMSSTPPHQKLDLDARQSDAGLKVAGDQSHTNQEPIHHSQSEDVMSTNILDEVNEKEPWVGAEVIQLAVEEEGPQDQDDVEKRRRHRSRQVGKLKVMKS